jgi:hypothetical protein
MFTKLVFIISILFTFSTFAFEKLCTISSDMDGNTAILTYEFDQDQRTITHLYQESYENGKIVSRDELNIDGLNNGGIVLLKKDNINVVRIWSDNFDRNLGGVLYLDTLYSALSGERRQYEMDIVHSKNNLVLINNKVEFDKMKFIAKRSKLFGVIGIEKIQFSK